MAAALPAKLKIPSIQPFASRAAQLEKYKPIISYWCDYHIVNQILSKGLHSADDECRDYTTNLMDKLEVAKADGVDAITDDIAAKAYVEQFAVETFQRADDAIHTNKASRQTIDTFQAASTFLELLSIWSPLDAETTSKIKYAKYHALRIAKAIKAGEDPNASNPVAEEPPVESSDAMPGIELQSPSGTYRPPTVESAPDSVQPSRPGSVAQATPFVPPALNRPSVPASAVEQDVSPIEPAESAASRQGSVGGGYFPSVPTFTSGSGEPSAPTAGPDSSLPGQSDPIAPNTINPPFAPPNTISSPGDFYKHPSQAPPPMHYPPPPAPQISRAVPAPVLPPSQPQVQAVPPGGYRTDDESVALAQKHAKWAISALNFEDVPTAVKELKLALQTLGAP